MAKWTQIQVIELDDASGATITNTLTDTIDTYVISSDGALTATGNFSFSSSGTMYEGATYRYRYIGNIDLITNSANLSFHGVTVPRLFGQLRFEVIAIYEGSSWRVHVDLDANQNYRISTNDIVDESITLGKLADLSDGHIIAGNGSNRPEAIDLSTDGFVSTDSGTISTVTITGDVDIDPDGTSSIPNGTITNDMVNSSAAIARNKMATGTASHVLINDGSGVLSSEAQLATSRGGTGQNLSASTGILRVNAGTVSADTIDTNDIDSNTIQPSNLTQLTRTEVLTKYISFESGFTGTYYQYVPFKGTLTYAKVRVIKLIEATDNATIQLKDDSSTNMTDGLITITAGSTHGTGVAVTPSANNTFNPGDEIQLTAAKSTAGGVVEITLIFERSDS